MRSVLQSIRVIDHGRGLVNESTFGYERGIFDSRGRNDTRRIVEDLEFRPEILVNSSQAGLQLGYFCMSANVLSLGQIRCK